MSNTDERALKPCPFCGHVGLDFAEGSTFRWIVASCAGCGATTGETRIQTMGQGTKDEWMADARRDAIAAWNRRAALSTTPPQPINAGGLTDAEIERLAREDAGGSDIDWTNEANLFATAPQRAAFRRGCRAAIDRELSRVPEGVATPMAIHDPDYARIFTKARAIAWSEGYALMAHGSMTRDFDLLLVPWEKTSRDPDYVINRIADACGLKQQGAASQRPHGRLSWTLTLPGFAEPRWVDISSMPALAAAPTPGSTS